MFVRHLVNVGNIIKRVEMRQIVYKKCNKCNKEIPDRFFGIDVSESSWPNGCKMEQIVVYTKEHIIDEAFGDYRMKGIFYKKECKNC
jgi:hypothetical protein